MGASNPSSSQMATTASAIAGNASTSSSELTTMSNTRSSARLQLRDAEAVAEDDPARVEDLEVDLAGLALEETGQFQQLDASQAAFDEFVQGEALAAIVHGNDDLVDVVLHGPARTGSTAAG